MTASSYRTAAAMLTAVPLSLVLALAGCGSEDSDGNQNGNQDGGRDGKGARTSAPPSAGGSRAPSEKSTNKPSPSATPTPGDTSAADGTDVGACFDGRCEIAVSAPTDIAVDSRFGVSGLSVADVTSDAVIVEATGSGGSFMQTEVGPGGTGGVNGLGFRVTSLVGGTAVLQFFPQK